MRGVGRPRLAEREAAGLGDLGPTRLCEVCAEVAHVSGAGIMVMSGDTPLTSVCTNDVSALLEELQHKLGEGPCVDAYHHGRPALEPDLAGSTRWPAFSAPAVDAGVRAIFGFPLQVGALRLGALNLYCDRPGPLTDDQQADALALADLAAEVMLVMQTNAPSDRLSRELAQGDLEQVVNHAAGMVAAQLGVGLAEALACVRDFALTNDHPLKQVAEDVVARRLLVLAPESSIASPVFDSLRLPTRRTPQ